MSCITTASPEPFSGYLEGQMMPCLAEEMLDGQHQSVPHIPLMTQLVKGLNLHSTGTQHKNLPQSSVTMSRLIYFIMCFHKGTCVSYYLLVGILNLVNH